MTLLLLRKIRSLQFRILGYLSTLRCYLSSLGNPAISIGSGCTSGTGVSIRATDGGSIVLGRGVSLANHVQIVAQGGQVTIGEDVFIGTGCIIVCKESIVIGKDTQIAEYVVIRDQDHRIDSRPIRLSGFHTSPIHIGDDVWVGCKASILRGSSIGDRCVIGAHALVKSKIDDDMLAVGIPARSIRRVEEQKASE